jgi:hypothetical protein
MTGFAVFGPGALYLTRVDIANATPINIGYANEFSLDETGETKELYGQLQYPLAAARGTIKATGKAKAAVVSGIAINAAFHGASFSAGQLLMAQSEAGSIPSATAYTVTVANEATFDTDLGVVYAANGLPLQKVSGAPTAAGQYSVSAGVYTFYSADAGLGVLITYAYTKTGSGQTKLVTAQLIGASPVFQLDYATSWNNNPYYLRIFRCIASKLSQSFKLSDYMMPELDFSVFADPAGRVYEASYPSVS